MANTAAAVTRTAPAVLLVEANATQAAMLSQLLAQQLNAAVAVVTTFSDARLALGAAPFDCVVTELQLPDCHGQGVIVGLVAAAGDVPVIVLTADADEETAVAALASGAHDVLRSDSTASRRVCRSVRFAIQRRAVQQAARELFVAQQRQAAQASALRDPLTGLPSPGLFRDRLEHAIARMSRHAAFAAVLSLDLDEFTPFTSTHGPDVADAVLQVVAHRLESTARATDTVTRLDHDRFLVLCEDLNRPDEAAVVADRLRQAISRPIEIDGDLVEVTATVASTVVDRTMDAESVLRRADAAITEVAAAAPHLPALASGVAPDNPGPRMLQDALERALVSEAFSLAFQPVTDLPSGRLVAVEALLRWDDGERIRQPDEFLPVAEATGLILPIGAWVLREACATLARWREQGEVDEDVTMSVNVAARQLCDERLFTDVIAALDAAGLPPENLAIEITETTLIGDPETAGGTLKRLKEIGVSVWLDDFGTGYSSLSYLDQYPVDAIKLDRSFLRKLGDRRGRALLIMVSDLAARLGIAAIAEGVETEEQREIVTRLGFTAAQGFYLGHPQLTVDLLQAT